MISFEQLESAIKHGAVIKCAKYLTLISFCNDNLFYIKTDCNCKKMTQFMMITKILKMVLYFVRLDPLDKDYIISINHM